ncbi:dynein light chain Tctex-type 1 [Halyomorpha halys]|uniref:dynein light chain Tctex-type 1 n=1 Tax=Halyomorpha halys TaxID=286706 RepID=UPI0006D4DB03|nr:dynein light chain Tctex-type 1-like [Halyomorpha halys]
MDFKTGDQFDIEKVAEIVKDAVEEAMGKTYPIPSRLKTWTANVGEECLEKIALMKSPLKYLVFTDMMEDNGAGYHFYMSAMWESDKDGYYSFKESREAQHVWMAINIIGVAI